MGVHSQHESIVKGSRLNRNNAGNYQITQSKKRLIDEMCGSGANNVISCLI